MRQAFADGEYNFILGMDEAIEFERTRGGLFRALVRMTQGDWFVSDLVEIIRLALIGGGMPAEKAKTMVDYYVKKRPMADNTKLCLAILEEAFFGPDAEDVDAKVEAGAEMLARSAETLATILPDKSAA